MFKPQKKNQTDESDSSGTDSEPEVQKFAQKKKNIRLNDDSDIEEINSSQFEPQTPEIKPFKGSLQSNQSGGDFYGNKELKAIFDEFMPTLEKEPEKKIKENFEKNLTEESDLTIEEKKINSNGPSSWVKNLQLDLDEKIEANCVKVFNIHSNVCNKVLWELFSKVGRIKRLTLYRITNKDIESSIYLKSLNLHDESTRPHKKRAEIEYQAPNYSQNAVTVFNQLELYEKKIFVYKTIDDSFPRVRITFQRNLYPWLDEFFCLDYFSRSANIIRIITTYPDTDIRITIVVPEKNDLNLINDCIKNELFEFVPDIKLQFHPKLNFTRDDRREIKSSLVPEKKKAKLLESSNEDGYIQ